MDMDHSGEQALSVRQQPDVFRRHEPARVHLPVHHSCRNVMRDALRWKRAYYARYCR
jgi:hypothetical protein